MLFEELGEREREKEEEIFTPKCSKLPTVRDESVSGSLTPCACLTEAEMLFKWLRAQLAISVVFRSPRAASAIEGAGVTPSIVDTLWLPIVNR